MSQDQINKAITDALDEIATAIIKQLNKVSHIPSKVALYGVIENTPQLQNQLMNVLNQMIAERMQAKSIIIDGTNLVTEVPDAPSADTK